jgi:hypothetical protein
MPVFTDKEVQDLKETFKMFDTNNDVRACRPHYYLVAPMMGVLRPYDNALPNSFK